MGTWGSLGRMSRETSRAQIGGRWIWYWKVSAGQMRLRLRGAVVHMLAHGPPCCPSAPYLPSL